MFLSDVGLSIKCVYKRDATIRNNIHKLTLPLKTAVYPDAFITFASFFEAKT